MRIMAMLNISEEEIEAERIERERQEQIKHQKLNMKWGAWQEKSKEKFVREPIAKELKTLIENGAEILCVKANKSQLNKLITWSSSRYNEYKKSYVVCSIIHKVDCIEYPHFKDYSYVTGCFSAGAHGVAGGTLGGSNFKTAYRKYSSYQIVVLDSLPYLLLDNTDIVQFAGFDYPKYIEVDEEFMSAYTEFQTEKSATFL